MNTEEMLRNPELPVSHHIPHTADSPETKRSVFRNEPSADFSRSDTREEMKKAIETVRSRPKETIPLFIGGRNIETEETLESLNPSRTSEVIGRTMCAGIEEAEEAVQAAAEAFREWRFIEPENRADYFFTAASLMREKHFELAALEVLEAGKPYREADADVCEAIDFIEYYARRMLELCRRRVTQHLPGEKNTSGYIPRGVTAVIAPWNFPLAILTGMTTAALVTGNTVVMKPAAEMR